MIAGDLFDRDLLRIPTEVWLPEVLGRATAAGVTVIAVTGNHDPGVPGGPVDRIGWPSARFHLVRDRRADAHRLRRGDGSLAGVVLAAGHEPPRERENLAARFATVSVEPGVPVSACSTHRCTAPWASTIATRRARPPTSPRRGTATGRSATSHRAGRSRRLRSPGTPAACRAATSASRAPRARSTSRSGRRPVHRRVPPARAGALGGLELDDLGEVATRREIVEHVTARSPTSRRRRARCRTSSGSCASSSRGRTPYFAELRGAEAADDLAVMLRERLGVLAVDVRDEGVTAADRRRGVRGRAARARRGARDDPPARSTSRCSPSSAGPARRRARRSGGARAYVRALLDGLELEVAPAHARGARA